MDNNYKLTITVISANGEQKETTVADPFGKNDKKQQDTTSKMESFTKSAMKAVATRTATSIVRGGTATLGNSHIQEQMAMIEGGISFATQTAVATAAFGPAGLLMSLLSLLPMLVSRSIEFSQGKTWDRLSMNKNLQRAGGTFNRSRLE